MLVLTGTSGNLGGGVLKNIVEKELIPTSEVMISAYNTDAVPAIAKKAGIEVRHGNYEKPETLVSSFTGADTLFLVSYPSVSEERFVYHKAAIDAAKQAGVSHVIYTSLTYGGPTGEDTIAGVMKAHVNTVKYLKASGLTYTIVREASYAEIWSISAGFLQLDDSNKEFDIVVPGNGGNTWASRDELAEATAIIVANKDEYKNQSISLTGPRSTTITEIGSLLQEYTGRKVNVKIVSPEEAIAYHKAQHSLPPEQEFVLESWVSWFKANERGEGITVDPAMEKLLGRKPKGLKEMASQIFQVNHKMETTDFENYTK
ncbi:hypothetical protein K450DRAFT_206476 [Umbelopsis ramanniana AG]|uniref:NmrA-like domain-containing protein n=1 Tax=Umbelopsis ramanniana AG TaxID=1314678 RepID=A0AAD5EG22_UMBRA|nr:uncharacterized protein K450DRAFT_206476 [Umbelopsis ramanniana AG]KAI8582365.1 hypothetical protein K450DRAFT_206476 [Umbelopsis ramanniana AG]